MKHKSINSRYFAVFFSIPSKVQPIFLSYACLSEFFSVKRLSANRHVLSDMFFPPFTLTFLTKILGASGSNKFAFLIPIGKMFIHYECFLNSNPFFRYLNLVSAFFEVWSIMADRVFLPIELAEDKEVILVDGKCFERVGPSEIEPDTFSVEQTFESCMQCEDATTSSSMGSVSESTGSTSVNEPSMSGSSTSFDPDECVYLYDQHPGIVGGSGISTIILDPPDRVCPGKDPIGLTVSRTASNDYVPSECSEPIHISVELPNAEMKIESTNPITDVMQNENSTIGVWWPADPISPGQTQYYTVSFLVESMDASDCSEDPPYLVIATGGCEESSWVLEYKCFD